MTLNYFLGHKDGVPKEGVAFFKFFAIVMSTLDLRCIHRSEAAK